MKRGINYKRINVTLDSDSLLLLEKYKKWGTPMSVHIRRALRDYEFRKAKGQTTSTGQESTFEESTVVYD
jgi:hypothetical protein